MWITPAESVTARRLLVTDARRRFRWPRPPVRSLNPEQRAPGSHLLVPRTPGLRCNLWKALWLGAADAPRLVQEFCQDRRRAVFAHTKDPPCRPRLPRGHRGSLSRARNRPTSIPAEETRERFPGESLGRWRAVRSARSSNCRLQCASGSPGSHGVRLWSSHLFL